MFGKDHCRQSIDVGSDTIDRPAVDSPLAATTNKLDRCLTECEATVRDIEACRLPGRWVVANDQPLQRSSHLRIIGWLAGRFEPSGEPQYPVVHRRVQKGSTVAHIRLMISPRFPISLLRKNVSSPLHIAR